MRQVFISCAFADRDLAQRLAESLRQAGVHVWDPSAAIFPGDNWALAVGKALEESEVMVPLITRSSRESTRVRDDVAYALTAGNYRGRVLPVLVDLPTFEAGSDVPWVLLRFQNVHVESSKLDFSNVVEHVLELVGADHAASG